MFLAKPWETMLQSALLTFLKDEKGGPTIEFILTVPPMLAFLISVTDASLIYLTHTDMFRMTRDIARSISVGSMTVDQVPAYVQQSSMFGDKTYAVITLSGALIIVNMQVSIDDANIFGFFEPVVGRMLQTRVEMRREPTLVPDGQVQS